MLFCGIDIGTTNTKAILVDGSDLIIDRITIRQQPRTDIHRMDAHIWYDHFCSVMEKFSPHFTNETVYVSLTTQGASFVLLDKDFKAIVPAWVWTGQAESETVGSPDIHGLLTEQNLAQFRCDIAFVGADAVDSSGITYTDDLRVLNIDRAIQKIASKVIVVADSTKFGGRAMCKVYGSKDYHLLITDAGLHKTTAKLFAKIGIPVEIGN